MTLAREEPSLTEWNAFRRDKSGEKNEQPRCCCCCCFLLVSRDRERWGKRGETGRTFDADATGELLEELWTGVDEVEGVRGRGFLFVEEKDGPRDEVAEVEEPDV